MIKRLCGPQINIGWTQDNPEQKKVLVSLVLESDLQKLEAKIVQQQETIKNISKLHY